MKKTIKIFILTTIIIFSFNDNLNIENNNYIKSDIVDIKSTSNVVRKTINPIVNYDDVKTSYSNIHSATWYNSHGSNTASGQIFHRDSLTAAYNNANFGTYLKVTNVENNESIIVKVTDRMGNKSPNRIDLSRCAFDSIASISHGRLKVKLEEIKKPL